MKRISSLIISVLIICPASWASPGLDQGIALYNSGRYADAIAAFQQEIESNPNDATSHYYTGVCYHCMLQLAEASREYAWVAQNSADPELLKRARIGLQVLSRAGVPPGGGMMQSTPSMRPASAFGRATAAGTLPDGYSQARPPLDHTALANGNRNGIPTSGMQQTGYATPGWPATNSMVSASPRASRSYGNIQPLSSNAPKIFDFYTDWCGWCKRFEPIFEEAHARYGEKVSFHRINAEAVENVALVKKYKVRGFPTILFIDSSGKLVKRLSGAPRSLQDFEQDIFGAFPSLVRY